jgi:hypothetical protein
MNTKISRVVKMTFKQETMSDFLELFNKKKSQIRNFEGCTQLQLIQDQTNPYTLYTYSCWDSQDSLDNYRNSHLFKETWAETKKCFGARPEAFSLNRLIDVEK